MSKLRGVIVEGSDCSGKTTLVKRLKAALSDSGWDVLDMGHKPGDQFARYLRTYLDADGLVLDRGHLSEVVYGDLWREGRHFAPWERQLLDDLVKDEFLLVLCTASPEVLAERYGARTYGQVAAKDELSRIQEHFESTLAPLQPLRYTSTDEVALSAAVNAIRSRLAQGRAEATVLRTAPEDLQRPRQFVILEGANGSGKSTLAKLLKVHLVGWHVKTLDYDPTRPPFKRFLSEYCSADRAIFDRGHFSEIVYGDLFREGCHFTPSEQAHLSRYLAARGLLVLCEAPPESLVRRISSQQYPKHISTSRVGDVQNAFRESIERAGVPFRVVQTEDQASVGRAVAEIQAELHGVAYASMGWDQ